MADVEAELDPAAFCRIHRSAIVNLERVRGIETAEEGGAEVLLTTGARLRISRRYRHQLEQRLLPRP